MNYLLHRQNVPHKTAKLPEGLNDLMSDISREVLRQQPDQNSIYEYIADYLEALIGTRDRAEAIQMIINDQIENAERVKEILKKSGISLDKAEMAARIIQESYKNFVKQKKRKQSIATCDMFDEIALLRELITKCNLTADEIVKARPAVKKAYREFIDGYMNAMKASLLGQKVVPLSMVAKIFLEVPSMRQIDKNACVIQSAYRAYMKRKSLRLTSANIKVFLEKIKKKKRDALVAEKTIRLKTTHLDENETLVVNEFQKHYEENVVKQIEAATLIQKAYRGYFIRRDIKLEHTRLVVEKQKSKSAMTIVDNDIQDIYLKGGQDTLDTKSLISLSDISESEFQQQISELDKAIKELDAQDQCRNYDMEEAEILKRDMEDQIDDFERSEEYELYTIKEDKEKEDELEKEAVKHDEDRSSDPTTEILNTERRQAGDAYKKSRDTEEELASEAAKKYYSERDDDLHSNLTTDELETDRLQEIHDIREYLKKEDDLTEMVVVEDLGIDDDLEPDDTALPTERMFAGDAYKEQTDVVTDDDIDNDDDLDDNDVQSGDEQVKNENTVDNNFEEGERPFVFPADTEREYELEEVDTNPKLGKTESILVTSADSTGEKKSEPVVNVAEITKELLELHEVSGPDDIDIIKKEQLEVLPSDDDTVESVVIEVSTPDEDSSSRREQLEMAAVVKVEQSKSKIVLEVSAPDEEVVSVKEHPELSAVVEAGKVEFEVSAPDEEVFSVKEHPEEAAIIEAGKVEFEVSPPDEGVVSVKEHPELAAVVEAGKVEFEVSAPDEEIVGVKKLPEPVAATEDSKK